MDGFDNEAIDRVLKRLEEARACGLHIGRAERRKIGHQIEVLERRFSKFLSEREGVPKLREDAKKALSEFAQGRFGGLNSDQVEAAKKQLSQFLADSEDVPEQLAAVEGEFLKFATMRALLSGERGN